MKARIILIFLMAFILLTACEKRKAYQEATKELEAPVIEFFIQRGEKLSDFSAKQYADDIYLIKASTDKSDGWGLVAQKKQDSNRIYWQIDVGTTEKLTSLNIDPAKWWNVS